MIAPVRLPFTTRQRWSLDTLLGPVVLQQVTRFGRDGYGEERLELHAGGRIIADYATRTGLAAWCRRHGCESPLPPSSSGPVYMDMHSSFRRALARLDLHFGTIAATARALGLSHARLSSLRQKTQDPEPGDYIRVNALLDSLREGRTPA